MMKKNILLVIPSFGIGGTTVSTRHLISILDKSKYNVFVLSLSKIGILNWLYNDVKLVRTSFTAQLLALESWKMEKNCIRKILAAILRFVSNHCKTIKLLLIKNTIKNILSGSKFDIVISCQEGITTEFVSHMTISQKIAWVRCDYKRYFKINGYKKESFYNDYSKIVCVSEQTLHNFIEIYPELKKRTICIHNPQDSKLIISQSNINDEDIRFKTDKTVIVSVGRLDPVKRFSSIPHIANLLVEKGCDFYWYIIGEGPERLTIEAEIFKNKVSKQVILLGSKNNPHFYIKVADIYVCLSASEACPRVINEAKILGTPVVSTDFPTVHEYLTNGENGSISSIHNIHKEIFRMLNDYRYYKYIKSINSSFVFDNTSIVKKIESILI